MNSWNSTGKASMDLQRVLERFDWIVENVRDEVHRTDVESLRVVLADDEARLSEKERALVMLGLLGNARAEALLRWWRCDTEHDRLRLLHRLASSECARRRGRAKAAARVGEDRRAA